MTSSSPSPSNYPPAPPSQQQQQPNSEYQDNSQNNMNQSSTQQQQQQQQGSVAMPPGPPPATNSGAPSVGSISGGQPTNVQQQQQPSVPMPPGPPQPPQQQQYNNYPNNAPAPLPPSYGSAAGAPAQSFQQQGAGQYSSGAQSPAMPPGPPSQQQQYNPQMSSSSTSPTAPGYGSQYQQQPGSSVSMPPLPPAYQSQPQQQQPPYGQQTPAASGGAPPYQSSGTPPPPPQYTNAPPHPQQYNAPPQYSNVPQQQQQQQLSQQFSDKLSLNSSTPPYQQHPSYEAHAQQRNAINTSQSSSLPRPQVASINAESNQPDVSPLFERIQHVDMSHAQARSRYLRTTAQCAPNAPALSDQWALPFGAIFTPFADPPEDDDIPVVSMGSAGVVRCQKCRAYINPYVSWMDGGRRWQCNLCRYTNDVSTPYFSPLDENNVRKDLHRRRELTHGSIELMATKEYCTRKNPQPSAYLFLIDVSYNTVQSGALKVIADTILNSLDHLAGDIRTRVGFITFNSTVHFYNLRSNLKTPQRLIVGELDESLLPIPTDLLVNLFDSKTVVKNLLKTLPKMFESRLEQQGPTTGASDGENCLGAALNAAGRILGKIGGKLSLFMSSIPTMGPNSLKNREVESDYGTPKELELLKPVNSNFRDLALLFSRDQICVDQYILTAQYTDMASLYPLSKFTAGQVKQYPGFEASADGQTLQYDLIRALTREQGMEAVMKVRVSSGFKVKNFYGNFFIRGHDLLALPGVDADKSFGFELAHTGSYISTPNACIQAAVLYTNSNGERRVRIHNLILPLTANLSDMYTHTDIDAVMNLLAKSAVDDIPRNGLQAQRSLVRSVVEKTVRAYRKNVRSGSNGRYSGQTNQLVLPDSLRLLPLYVNGLLKHDSLAQGVQVRADARISAINQLTTASVLESVPLFHPLLFAVHQLNVPEDDENQEDEDQSSSRYSKPPQLLPLTQQSTSDPRGVYALCDGQTIYVYHRLEQSTSTEDASLVEDIKSVSKRLNTFPLPSPRKIIGETSLGKNLCRLVKQLRQQYRFMAIQLVTPESQRFVQVQFSRRLIEDQQSAVDESYEKFISEIHKQSSK